MVVIPVVGCDCDGQPTVTAAPVLVVEHPAAPHCKEPTAHVCTILEEHVEIARTLTNGRRPSAQATHRRSTVQGTDDARLHNSGGARRKRTDSHKRQETECPSNAPPLHTARNGRRTSAQFWRSTSKAHGLSQTAGERLPKQSSATPHCKERTTHVCTIPEEHVEIARTLTNGRRPSAQATPRRSTLQERTTHVCTIPEEHVESARTLTNGRRPSAQATSRHSTLQGTDDARLHNSGGAR